MSCLYFLVTRGLLKRTAVVLGRPGSGCSTLLKALANQTDEYAHVLGERRYNAFCAQRAKQYCRGDIIYCPEEYAVSIPFLHYGEN